MHLVVLRRNGIDLPAQLPPQLLPDIPPLIQTSPLPPLVSTADSPKQSHSLDKIVLHKQPQQHINASNDLSGVVSRDQTAGGQSEPINWIDRNNAAQLI